MARKRKVTGNAHDIKLIKTVQALKKHPTLQDAYQELHPKSSPESSRKNARSMLTPEVVEAFKKAMALDEFATATKATLEKVLFTVVARWYAGEESTMNLIAAVRELTKIVPGWEDKLQIQESDDESEIDRKLRASGIDPTKFENRN